MRITYILLSIYIVFTNTCFAMADFKLFPEILEFLFIDRYHGSSCMYRYSNQPINNGYSVLYKAAADGNETLVASLLKQGSIEGRTAMFEALCYKNIKAVRLLLCYGVDIQDVNIDNTYMSCQIAALLRHYRQLYNTIQAKPLEVFNEAIKQGYLSLVKLLIARGVPITLEHVALAKKSCEQAEYKDVYRVIGRLLIAHLRLTGDLKLYKLHYSSCFLSSLLLSFLSKHKTDHIEGPIAHNGLQAAGLPKNVVEDIARMVVSAD